MNTYLRQRGEGRAEVRSFRRGRVSYSALMWGQGEFGMGQGRKKREARVPSEVGSPQGPKEWERVGDWKGRIRNHILRVHHI